MTDQKPWYIIQPRTILPLMIFLGVLVVGIRLNDIWDSLAEGRIFQAVTPSKAASEGEVPKINTPSLAPASGTTDSVPAKGEKPAAEAKAAPQSENKTAPTETKAKPSKPPMDSSSAEMELVKQLTGRREQLDQRARELDMYEARLRVAEQRVDQKMKEMETLRTQLQTMVNQLNASQQAQIENLVKIYETMKPKEAARIFESLELPVLLGVVQKMKPQRTAAVMAEMAPEKAKEITIALTKQDQLPQIK